MSKSNNAVEVRGIKKSFYLPNHKNDSIKRAITQAFKKKDKGGNTFNALNGISFDIEKGDFFGILGRNGSGKSTLLKIIAEIYQPTSGTVMTQGKVVSFIELGVGFKPELSGRENVYLNGALLGFSRKEIDAMYDDIVEFAELEKFMGQRLKNYSSGMKVRLAFSVAIRAKADILILDEVLAVGDAAFQKKCYDYFGTLKEDGKTVILVTHSMGNVRKFCNKAVVIDDGKVVYEGGADGAADRYMALFSRENKAQTPSRTGTHNVMVDSIKVDVTPEDIIVDYLLVSSKLYESVKVAVDIRKNNDSKTLVAGVPGSYFENNLIAVDKKHEGSVVFDNRLYDGEYSVYIRIRNADNSEVFDKWNNAVKFTIDSVGIESALPVNILKQDKTNL